MEKATAPHSSTLAWKIPCTEEPGRLQSMASLSWTRLSNFTYTFHFHFHALEKEMATHSSVLAWRIPGTEEPGGLPSMGSHRVGHDWNDLAASYDIKSSREYCNTLFAQATKSNCIVSIYKRYLFVFHFSSFCCCSVAKLCPTLSNLVDCSTPGSSVHGIFQARVLEWGAIAFFVLVWDECNCEVVWAFFGIAFLLDWNENGAFSVLWPLLNFPNLLAYWVQHFHSIIFQDLK